MSLSPECLAGAIGLHRAEVVHDLRPEILAYVLGSLISASIFKEFLARAGSAVSHNFGLVSSPAGVGPNDIAAVNNSFILLFFIGFTMRQNA